MIDETRPTRILRRQQVLERVPLTHTQIDNMERAGNFPKRIKLSVKAAGWVESEIEDWIASRIAASRGGQSAAA
jgi:prophage regulatory protein